MPLVLACAACAGATVQTSPVGHADSSAGCRPAGLRAQFRGFQGAGDSLSGALVVIDTAARPCWLDGSPRSVDLLDDGGDTVSVRQRPVDSPAVGPVQLLPGVALPEFGAPPGHGSAWLSLNWTNWCAAAGPAISATLVVLPGGGSITGPIDPAQPSWAVGPAVPRCRDAREPSSLTFGRFQPAA